MVLIQLIILTAKEILTDPNNRINTKLVPQMEKIQLHGNEILIIKIPKI